MAISEPIRDDLVEAHMEKIQADFPGCVVVLVIGRMDDEGIVADLSATTNAVGDDDQLTLLKAVTEDVESGAMKPRFH